MEGTVISVNLKQNSCLVYVHTIPATYKAIISEQFKTVKVGDDCDFDVEKAPSFFAYGQAKLNIIKHLEFKNDKIAITPEANVAQHNIIKDNKDYLVAAEGGFERECRAALIEKALECKANALLDLKLECVIRPGVKTVLFRYTARPAIVEGPEYHQTPGQGLAIPTKVARRNSPNEAQVRYIRVLLICFLFITIPSIMRLTERGVIPTELLGKILTAGLIVLCMALFMFISFKRKKSFILNVKPLRKS